MLARHLLQRLLQHMPLLLHGEQNHRHDARQHDGQRGNGAFFIRATRGFGVEQGPLPLS